MPELELVLGGAPAAPIEAFEIAFSDDDGEQRLELTAALSVPFASCRPVREFASYKGQRHLSGQWWTATTGTLVGYESWLERDRLLLNFRSGRRRDRLAAVLVVLRGSER